MPVVMATILEDNDDSMNNNSKCEDDNVVGHGRNASPSSTNNSSTSFQDAFSKLLDVTMYYETPLILYRQQLKLCFRQLLQQYASTETTNETSSSIISYNCIELCSYIENINLMSWVPICMDYDQRCNKNNSNVNGKSINKLHSQQQQNQRQNQNQQQQQREMDDSNILLNEVLNCFVDPTVWPISCMIQIIVPSLLRLIVLNSLRPISTTTNDSSSNIKVIILPSKQRILRTINYIIFRQCTKMQLYTYLPNLIRTKILIDNTVNNSNNTVLLQYNVLSSIVQSWEKRIHVQYNFTTYPRCNNHYTSNLPITISLPSHQSRHRRNTESLHHYNMLLEIILQLLTKYDALIVEQQIEYQNKKQQHVLCVNDCDKSDGMDRGRSQKRRRRNKVANDSVNYLHSEMNEIDQEQFETKIIHRQHRRQQQRRTPYLNDVLNTPINHLLNSNDYQRNSNNNNWNQKQYDTKLFSLYQSRANCISTYISLLLKSLSAINNNGNNDNAACGISRCIHSPNSYNNNHILNKMVVFCTDVVDMLLDSMIQQHDYYSRLFNGRGDRSSTYSSSVSLRLCGLLFVSMLSAQQPEQDSPQLNRQKQHERENENDIQTKSPTASVNATAAASEIMQVNEPSLCSQEDEIINSDSVEQRIYHNADTYIGQLLPQQQPQQHSHKQCISSTYGELEKCKISNPTSYYQLLIESILVRAINEDNLINVCILLSYYTELIVECSYFDNDAHLWDALKPFINYLKESIAALSCMHHQQLEDNDEQAGGNVYKQEVQQHEESQEKVCNSINHQQQQHLQEQQQPRNADIDASDVTNNVSYDVFPNQMAVKYTKLHALDPANCNSCNGSCKIKSSMITSATTAIKPFLSCFAYLLSRRGNMLDRMIQTAVKSRHREHGDSDQCQQSVPPSVRYDDFQSLQTNMSLMFGQVSDWIDAMTPLGICPMSVAEKNSRIKSLQKAGIMSLFLDSALEKVNHAFSIDFSSSSVKTRGPLLYLPGFSDSESIRDAAARVRPWLGASATSCPDTLFSVYSPHNCIPQSIVLSCKTKTASQAISAAESPYLNADTLQILFSFLGYKRLHKMRLVCMQWKDIADSDQLWHSLYKSRYGFGPIWNKLEKSHKSDPEQPKLLLKHHPSSWKELFQTRWQIERDIRRKYCQKDGWKWQVCNHVGCLKILKSKIFLKKHYERHRQEFAKASCPITAATSTATTTTTKVKTLRRSNASSNKRQKKDTGQKSALEEKIEPTFNVPLTATAGL